MDVVIYTDGGSRGNPGEGAVGVVIEKPDGVVKFGERIGIVTNNEAEYQGVIKALEKVVSTKYTVSSIQFFMDSKLICEQLSGRWKIKQAHLQALLLKVKGLEQEIGVKISYNHIPREKNTEADRLVNEALDQP